MITRSAYSSLAALLERGANPSLRYHRDEVLLDYLAQRIEEVVSEATNPTRVLSVVHTLITDLDYRLVANYLSALQAADAAVVNAFERISETHSTAVRNQLLYEVAHARFSRTAPPTVDGDIVFVPHLEDVFSRPERRLLIYLRDQSLQSPLQTLLGDTGARLGDFIEQQYDLPSINALVCKGVVKTWVLPDGTKVVSKRENPRKPGGFRTELLNCEAVLSRLARQSSDRLLLQRTVKSGRVWLVVVRPFAVIHSGYSGHCYALSVRINGTPLEDLLLEEGDTAMRRAYLSHYRWLLDALYGAGILWDGLAPRNILVQRDGPDFVYYILDFEKMSVLDEPATTAERIMHCRGEVCVEELGVICTPTEVAECFRGYFAPAEWDLESEQPLSFAPRPEAANILRGRGLHDVTLGTYNRMDLEVMSVRIPDLDPTEERRRFPGHINFKIDHYLGCAGYDNADDYDRKATEILIAAKRHGCFDTVVDVLSWFTDRVESAFLKAEFEEIIDQPTMDHMAPPQQAVDALAQAVDVLYQLRERGENFRILCDRLRSDRSTGLQ